MPFPKLAYHFLIVWDNCKLCPTNGLRLLAVNCENAQLKFASYVRLHLGQAGSPGAQRQVVATLVFRPLAMACGSVRPLRSAYLVQRPNSAWVQRKETRADFGFLTRGALRSYMVLDSC